MPIQADTVSRYWSKVKKIDSCWLWLGAKNPKGYGLFRNGHIVLAHRFSYELLIGPIPQNMVLDHLCRNRACVNPSHLRVTSNQQNCQWGLTGAYNLHKTHCPAGHEYNEINTYIYITKNGHRLRSCRLCHSQRELRRRKNVSNSRLNRKTQIAQARQDTSGY